jgi:UDP-glucose 4-epimerase
MLNPIILIVGGAGYIGSHMTKYMRRFGYSVIVLDDLSMGHRTAVKDAEFVQGSVHDTELLNALFAKYPIAAVMHFASFIQVGESVIDPNKYYCNNVAGTLNLLNAMLSAKIKYFIFSSTAAVYGDPLYTPIDENHPIQPVNPYGRSKWMIEQILQDYAQSYDFRFTALRYFNAAGADPEGELGECHEPETHLIPLILQAAMGKRSSIAIYGNDYSTLDGTCIRDYIHVEDLCAAHFLALQSLCGGASSTVYNLGTGHGYSVREVIEAVHRVTGIKVPTIDEQRRAGDPAILVANASRAQKELAWFPTYSDLETLIRNAWLFEKRLDAIIPV